MLKMKNKKSFITIELLIKLVAGVFVLLVIILLVYNSLGKGKEETSDRITSSRDFDGDGSLDYFDKCPCDEGPEEDDGCPPGKKGYSDEEKASCDARRKGTST
jgi:hypothetical protein